MWNQTWATLVMTQKKLKIQIAKNIIDHYFNILKGYKPSIEDCDMTLERSFQG